MSSPNPSPAQDAWTIIQGLDGVDKKLLGHPGVAHIPSILEENELPEALTYDGGGKVFVATDRRIIEIETSMLRKSVRNVTSHPYQTILSFEADKGFMALGFSMVTADGTRTLAAQKASITTTLPQFGQFLTGNRFAEGKATKLSSAWAGCYEGYSRSLSCDPSL